MKRFFQGRQWVVLAIIAAFLVAVSAAPALAKDNPEKHERKIAKTLEHYKPGTLLRLAFANGSESQGTLVSLGEKTFTLSNSESNAVETHSYVEVDSVGKASNKIGKGSEEHHHHFPL
jgi:hypothetical protein